MNRTKRIKKILEKKLKDYTIIVIDNSNKHIGHNNFDGNGETHILVELTHTLIEKVNRLELHKQINHLLKEEFESGLHSLQIKII